MHGSKEGQKAHLSCEKVRERFGRQHHAAYPELVDGRYEPVVLVHPASSALRFTLPATGSERYSASARSDCTSTPHPALPA